MFLRNLNSGLRTGAWVFNRTIHQGNWKAPEEERRDVLTSVNQTAELLKRSIQGTVFSLVETEEETNIN